MLPRTVRGVVAVAAELAEEVGKRVVGTAAGLLERGGVDLSGVERRLGGQFPPSAEQLQTLAEEAVTAGRAGVDLAVGVARGEVERVFEKVGDQVTKVGVVLSYLESKLREAEGEPVAGPGAERPAPRADGLFGHGWESEEEPAAPFASSAAFATERVVVDEPAVVEPAAAEAGWAPAAEKAAAEKTATEKAPAIEKPAAKKTAAKKAVAKKTAAKKTAAKKTVAEQTAAKKTAAKKTAVKKTTVTRASAAEKAATEKAAAGQEPPVKRTATRKTTVRKAASRKKPDA